jgi:3-phenylpropionate/trans-cinnamate dioxygenase ferredoxin subunit
MTLTKVAKASEIKPGGMKVVEAGGVRIAICNVDGTFYAIEDVCTHDDGPLGEGTLDGCEVECPRHGARFDVRTGAVTRMPAIVPVKAFPVKVEGDQVLVEV